MACNTFAGRAKGTTLMIASRFLQYVSMAAVGALLISAPHGSAGAADITSWDGDARSAVRLLAATPTGDTFRAGIEIRLSPGWKTYWRYPGDSGVPPRFDFSKSENVKSVSVLWPAPHRFTDESGASLGYKGRVLLPLHVVPANPRRPVTLRLALDYAICENLCVPAKGAAWLELHRASSAYDSAVAAAEALVPKPARVGDAGPLAIRSISQQNGDPHPRIIVDVAAPQAVPLDLFAEGPTDDWALPLPDPIDGASPGLRRFSFELDGLPPGAKAAGAVLRLTLVAGEKAIEVTSTLE
jgi:DsbC/DsbD-like thiol-disulfide interchange protein